MVRIIALVLEDGETVPQAARLRATILEGFPKVAPFLPAAIFGGEHRDPPEVLQEKLKRRQLLYAEVSDGWASLARAAYLARKQRAP